MFLYLNQPIVLSCGLYSRNTPLYIPASIPPCVAHPTRIAKYDFHRLSRRAEAIVETTIAPVPGPGITTKIVSPGYPHFPRYLLNLAWLLSEALVRESNFGIVLVKPK